MVCQSWSENGLSRTSPAIAIEPIRWVRGISQAKIKKQNNTFTLRRIIMQKLEKANLFIGIIAGIPVVLGIIAWATGLLRNLQSYIQFLFIAVLLLVVLLLNFSLLSRVNRIIIPHKPLLVKSHTEPDTFIFLHGQWRRIPDWQTRDYLAHLLGFRPGEEDISLKQKDEVDKLQKGAPLESIFTYARK